MHPQYERAHGLTQDVIGAGIEVHRTLGPGLLESTCEKCLIHELELRGHTVMRQQQVLVKYKEIVCEESKGTKDWVGRWRKAESENALDEVHWTRVVGTQRQP